MRSSKSRSRKSGRTSTPNRSVGNVINRVFDSSGPEGKVRGTPQQIIDKYNQLARDAQLGNDRVAMENFQQHAEHYLRMLAEAQREIDQRREQQERENRERQAERDQSQNNQNQNNQSQGGQNNGNQNNGNQNNGNRDQSRDQQRDQGQNRDSGRDQGRPQNRDQDRDQGRDQGRDQNRDQNRDNNRDRPAQHERRSPAPAAQETQDTLSSDVMDLGHDSGLVETPESRSEAPPVAVSDTPKKPSTSSRPRSAPRPKAENDKADSDKADAVKPASDKETEAKPKPRSRAPRKPKAPATGGDDSSGTPEAAE
ncbi:MAG: DUF4167 domain-containing protein [Rhodobacterales bacterium]